MNIEEFKKKHFSKSKGMSIFESEEAQQFVITDSKVTIEDVKIFENDYNFTLPQSYIDFCIYFGGGEFGYITIFSLDKQGSFYMANNISKEMLSAGLIPFADDLSGGVYCFKLDENRIVTENIFNLYLGDWSIEKVNCNGFFDFILKYAYNEN